MDLWFWVVVGMGWLFFAGFTVAFIHSCEVARHEDEARFLEHNRQVMIERYFEEE